MSYCKKILLMRVFQSLSWVASSFRAFRFRASFFSCFRPWYCGNCMHLRVTDDGGLQVSFWNFSSTILLDSGQFSSLGKGCWSKFRGFNWQTFPRCFMVLKFSMRGIWGWYLFLADVLSTHSNPLKESLVERWVAYFGFSLPFSFSINNYKMISKSLKFKMGFLAAFVSAWKCRSN